MSTVNGRYVVRAVALGLATALVGALGCAEDIKTQPPPAARVQAMFDPGLSILPTPTDLARHPVTGLLNVPVADEQKAPAQASFDRHLNSLDGFPTASSGSLCLSGRVDNATLQPAIKAFILPKGPGELPVDISDQITAADPVQSLTCPVLTVKGCDPTATSASGCADDQRCIATNPQAPALGRCANAGYKVALSRNQEWERGRTFALLLTDDLEDEAGNEVIRSSNFEIVAGPRPLCVWAMEAKKCTYNYSTLIASSVQRSLDEANDFLDTGLTPEQSEEQAVLATLAAASQLEPVRAATDGMIRASGIARANVLVAWGFSTVSMAEALFDPSQGVIPGPGNDLVYDAVNKKVNLPPQPGESAQDKALREALNTLDGFSTTASYLATFSGKLDASKVQTGSELLLLNLSKPTDPPPQGTFAYAEQAGAVTMTPTKPLDEGTRYAVVLLSKRKNTTITNDKGEDQEVLTAESGGGLADDTGRRIVASSAFALAKSKAPLIDAANKSTVSVLDDATAARLEPLRQSYDGLLSLLEANTALNLEREDVVMLWTFTTQTFTTALTQLRALPYSTLAAVEAGASQAGPEFGGTHLLDPLGCGDPPVQPCWPAGVPRDAIAGWVPNGVYQSWNALDPATGAFRPDPATGTPTSPPNAAAPIKPEDEHVPFFLITPKGLPCAAGACPTGFTCSAEDRCVPAMDGPGWPIVVFQHGIVWSKVQLFAVANALAQAGFATLAFDAPFHGDRSACTKDDDCIDTPTKTVCDTAKRRCCAEADANDCKVAYFVDADANGVPDVSGGSVFVNTTNPFALRDNLRQYVIDASALLRAVAMGASTALVEVDGPTGTPTGGAVKLDPTQVHFVGYSMGGLLGTLILATDGLSAGAGAKRALLTVAGAPLVKVFEDTADSEFQQLVDALLTSRGLQRGDFGALQLLHTLQWIVDPADPANFARYLKDEQLPDLVASQVAGTTVFVPKKEVLVQVASQDEVIPFARQTALASFAGADVTKSTYDAGHGFLLKPDPANPGVIAAAQSQMASFLLTGNVCEPKPDVGTCE